VALRIHEWHGVQYHREQPHGVSVSMECLQLVEQGAEVGNNHGVTARVTRHVALAA
jgi:hypothetical protein